MELDFNLNQKKFDLDQTFDCGQCFRWFKIKEKWYGVVQGREAEAYICDNLLKINILNDQDLNHEDEFKFWENYFDLDTDYILVKEKLKNIDNTLDFAMEKFGGIRILNQNFWETLCSFIISQNNNIPRIKSIIKNFCRYFGKKLKSNYAFPEVNHIADLCPNDLNIIKSGFRSKYIIDAARKIKNGIKFEELANYSNKDVVKIISKIKGVGPKVSSCVLLYSFHRLNAFPIDVWIRRTMQENFSGKTSDIFGEFAGVAQQYLFSFKRTTKIYENSTFKSQNS
ncbi:MAG: DNA-3-methyladenine glycosylase 2 family protein [Candidatus Improbicoccus pseudotrichonymphae]|uniref:DNA-(apurinic or apyrimidinic site) lyase n=1 Tax=Candidatus Improbicoccus pseudotrichonymphae TaxID=3033792 RepID=A0AA48I0Z5_9FIRM|nr:MAG: DNA-3-methyladenine glycosylase 2 family protein [Candidatus Improbicoccus pseudotrichonymphae]